MKESFIYWNLLFLEHLKRDWKKIIIWICGLSVFSSAFIPSFEEIAKGNGLSGMFETLKNPAMISMVGTTPIVQATQYTLGALYAHEMLLFCSLLSMIISLLHVIAHTRKEEDIGLSEFVRAFKVGRQSNTFSVFVEIILINAIVSIFITGILLSFNAQTITMQGSLLYGATIGIAGIIGASIALLTAQIMPNASASTGLALSIVGLLYIIRGATDITNVELAKFNPIGWTYITYPFTENNWGPLGFAVIFIVIIVVIAFILESSRDMGTSYIPEIKGRPTAKNSLLSVRGLFLKINKGTIISWFIAFIIMGIAYGSIYGDMQTFLASNELMKQMFSQSNVSIEASFTSKIVIVMISLVTILPIAIINKLFNEENKARLNQMSATKVTRNHLYWTNIGLALCTGIIGIFLTVFSLGVTALTVMTHHENIDLADFLIAGYNLLPVVLFFTSMTALVLGWIPKIGKLIYLYLGYAFAINYFGEVLEFPTWFSKTSALNWLPPMPKESFEFSTFFIVGIISLVLMFIGYLGYIKRDWIG